MKKALGSVLATLLAAAVVLSASECAAQSPGGGEWKASFAEVVKQNQDSVVQLQVEVSKYEKIYQDFKEPGEAKQPILGRVLNFLARSVMLVACVLPCTAIDQTVGVLCRGGEPVPKIKKEGTGFVISQDGYILTNYHVVEMPDRVAITFRDGVKREGEVAGFERETDLALVKAQLPEGVTQSPVSFMDLDGVEVGDLVVAIGNPFGLTQSVTTGVVSSLRRQGPYIDYLQTDAALNPGNSGGPLLLSNGKVIGVNTMIFAGGQNLGFAIPSDVVLGVLESLKKGEVRRGNLGLDVRQAGGDATGKGPSAALVGLEVVYVAPAGPAARSGVKVGDLILEAGGKPMPKGDFLVMVATTPIGARMPLKIRRGTETLSIEAVVEGLVRRQPQGAGG